MSSKTTLPPYYLDAYGVAVRNGFAGTEEEWLESIRGPAGPAGPAGEPGPTGSPGPKGDTGSPGTTPNIQIGTVTTLPAGSAATASMTGTTAAPRLNLGIPTGATGQGFAVKGYYATATALTAAVPAPAAGDAYGVGTAAPYDIYIWDGVSSSWINNGALQGAKGDPGPKGDPGDTVPASTTTPLADGTASAGSAESYARGDHRHPTDSTRAGIPEDVSLTVAASSWQTASSSSTPSSSVCKYYYKRSWSNDGIITDLGLKNDATLAEAAAWQAAMVDAYVSGLQLIFIARGSKPTISLPVWCRRRKD